jgi:hypothetical protein
MEGLQVRSGRKGGREGGKVGINKKEESKHVVMGLFAVIISYVLRFILWKEGESKRLVIRRHPTPSHPPSSPSLFPPEPPSFS